VRGKIPPIQGKVRPPRPPAGYLARPRLDAEWVSWGGKSVVLVIAGAGSGKTSFLAACAASSKSPTAWLSIDERDRDLRIFCTDVRASLSAAAPSAARRRHGRDAIPSECSVADLIGRMHHPTGLRLILDDVHLIRDAEEVRQFLVELIRYLPDRATVVLSGREPIELLTAKRRTHGSLAQLTTRDLAFRPDEAMALFQRRFPLATIPLPLARRLVLQTEGWAAGIEIFLQLLDGSTQEAIERTLERMGTTGAGWFDYFAEEVVRDLDERTQHFLEHVSVLPTLTGDRCDRLLGIQTSRSLIGRLVRRNLFVVSADERGESFHIHALFRAFLRSRLRHRLSPAEYAAHLRTAARLLYRDGANAEAAEILAESGNVEETIELIESAGESLLAEGRYDALRRAFEHLPARSLHGREDALFVRARLHDFQSEWEPAESLYRRILQMDPGAARRAELMSLIGQIVSRRGESRLAYAWCRKAGLVRGRIDVRTRGRILATMGVCASELGRLDEGDRLLRRARDLYRKFDDPDGAARIDYLLAINVHLPRGEISLARQETRRALVHFRRTQDLRRICYSVGVLGFLAVEGGDVREGRDLAEETLRTAERTGQKDHHGIASYILGRAAQQEGDLRTARTCLIQSAEISDGVGRIFQSILARIHLAEVLLGQGQRCAAEIVIGEALAHTRRSGDRIREAQCLTVMGMLEVTDGPSRSWARAENILRACGARPDLQRLLLLRLDHGLPPRKAAAAVKELLSATAGPDRDLVLCVLEPERTARVLTHALALGIATPRIVDLLCEIGDRAVPPIAGRIQEVDEGTRRVMVEALTRIGGTEARRVLEKIARGAVDTPSASMAAEEVARTPVRPLRIEALGMFGVALGGEPLPADRWNSRRALRLFQFLLLHRFHWVPKEQVMDALWPHADPERATTSLWQSVHRLRRTLEPELTELRNSRYVRFLNEAYRIEPGDGFFYDVLDFERSVRTGERLLGEGRGEVGRRELMSALEVWKGEFLAESPYEEFAAEEREALNAQLLRCLQSLVESLAGARRWDEVIPLCRRGLDMDPYHEVFHYRSVGASLALGNRWEALQGYHRYEERLSRELGLLPSRRMKTIAEKIVALGAHPDP
jgi:ATP/maltotriose-dependent transcriptional regulator MalT/DNA-binding SARP family transcriptional activator